MLAVFAVLLAVTQPWLVVSDLHVDPFDGSRAPASYGRDTNWPLFDLAVREMRSVAPDARVVVIPGDFLAHHFGEKLRASGRKQSTSAAALATMLRIERSFAQAFPNAQFLVALGNNDDPCGDYRTAPGTPYLRAVAKMWAPLVNRGGVAPRFVVDFARLGSYTASLPGKRMNAVVIDDVFWSFVYRGCSPAARNTPQILMDWLSRTISGNTREHVLVMHIPPGVDPSTTLLANRFIVVPYWSGDVLDRFSTLVSRNRERLPFMLAGHVHHSDFRLVSGVAMFIAPSISPIYTSNPAFARMEIDSGGAVRDYRLYAYDGDADAWVPTFDFDAAYNAHGFSAEALTQAHTRIEQDRNVRELWVSSLVAGAPANEMRAGWRAYWCAQMELRSGYPLCAGDQRRVTVARVALVAVGVAAVVAVMWAGMRYARRRRRGAAWKPPTSNE